ncbi:phosphomethylpyrimidine kinase [Candidatus Woesearchaeota archaeon]|nr:phosphomethylpyrimidine kinase [Candidatus Woesearchaeota archaeon]
MYGKMYIALQKLEQCKEFSRIIPEVRTNLVYAKPHARRREDVLAVDGRITVVGGFPKAAGKIKFGCSSHMARLIIELGKYNSEFKAGIDFANDGNFAEWLENYCREKKWAFGKIDRSREPQELVNEDKPSMPWKVKQAVESAGKAPKIFYENSAVGKEPVSVLAGKDPIEVAEQAIEIAKKYRSGMKWRR